MKRSLALILMCFFALTGMAQVRGKVMTKDEIKQAFLHPPEAAKPWVFWYWMYGAVTHEGVTADLQAMHDAGIGGAYLMPIKSVTNPPMIPNPVAQLTPEWWAMVKYTMQEADRIGVKLAMHDCDGFALAGGPWITPELSMQKVVFSKTKILGGQHFNDTLATPAHYKNYYKDIEVLAYPSLPGEGISSYDAKPKVTTSIAGTDVQYLGDRGNKKNFTSADPCWIKLAFEKPFTCRSLVVHTAASNYQSQRLILEVSDDDITYRKVTQFTPPRHGWQDGDAEITNTIPATTARYFRFAFDKEGTEPGGEDLDFAKWKPTLKLLGIELSPEPKIHQYESKNGEVWRVSKATGNAQLPDDVCIPKDKIINLTDKLGADGKLNWQAPAGQWTIMRIGHTSTGHTNATGGAGNGLECDKFNPEAAKIQFDNWFGEAIKQGGPDLAKRVLKIFHVDSWECGSQNWSPVFAAEFKKRRGYDVLPYLPLLAGVPIESAGSSEKRLRDVRETIAELLVDNFYGTMAKLAHQQGCTFTGESVAPTMMSDGMLHYSQVDIPMGEFWFRSPTHDKPNDMLDAISGGHIYGKNIISAEAFTQLRIFWDEHPGMLKPLVDLNFALGINRMVFHVNAHNPWLDRKPGMTLDGIGVFFSREQTWWKPGKAWFDYIQRTEALLQMGHPVADVAVFTGEEVPRRALLPERLVSTLPGIFGEERVKSEAKRLANAGVPMISTPEDAGHTDNMYLPQEWIDPLRGYAYDSMNKDALLRLATVKDGRIVLPGGASYGVLVIPKASAMSPNENMSVQVINKLQQLAKDGARIIIGDKFLGTAEMSKPGHKFGPEAQVFRAEQAMSNGRTHFGAYTKNTFDDQGISPDVIITDQENNRAKDVAWTHRKGEGFDIYFISNQQNSKRELGISLRSGQKAPEIWDPVTTQIKESSDWQLKDGRSIIKLNLEPTQALFVVLRNTILPNVIAKQVKVSPQQKTLVQLKGSWKVQFNPKQGGPKQPVIFANLQDWSKNADTTIRYYSGTAVYTQAFNWKRKINKADNISVNLGAIANMAEVYVNGVNCGTAWTPPYRVNINKALKPGVNHIKIAVTNTWANRLMGDHRLPATQQTTWTNAPYRLEKRDLLPAGLFGPVNIMQVNN